MLTSRGAVWRYVLAGTAAVAVALVAPASGATARAAHPKRTMTVAPSLGLPGVAVHVSGTGVPRHLRLTVLFDVTTRSKVRLCTTTNGASTKWRCTGRLPARYGALGPHTVEMDATPVSGRGGFEELSTFLVTDLGILMAAPASTAPGDTVQLRLTASNGNPTGARGVLVRDYLPSGMHLTRASTPCTERHGLVSCGPFRMAAHTARTFVLTTIVTVEHAARLSDTATIRGTPDPLKRNDVARVLLAVS